MALLDYTTPDAVRAVLGVSDDELEDGTLALELYSNYLQMELEDINLNLPVEYAAVAAIAEGSRTAAQQRFYIATRLFAPYSVANQLGSSLPMFGPKDISDGKATVGRFADSPYRATLEKVKKEYDRLKLRLDEMYAALTSSTVVTTSRVLMSVSSPSSDPVTGT